VAGEWTTWRSYENNFKQRLSVGAGRYWQQGYAAGPIWSVRYDHAWELDRRLALRYGIGRLLQPYDGVGTGRTFFSLTLDWRFL
jgi:biofilm PGA synthesis protein PgaA